MRIVKSLFSPIRDNNLIIAEMVDGSFMVGEEGAVSDKLLGITGSHTNTDDFCYAEEVLQEIFSADMKRYEEGIAKQPKSEFRLTL